MHCDAIIDTEENGKIITYFTTQVARGTYSRYFELSTTRTDTFPAVP